MFPILCRACTRVTVEYIPGTQTGPDESSGTPMFRRCAAYPDGIPASIGRGADHREPRGDEAHGIVFRQLGGEEGAQAFSDWFNTFAA